MMWNFYSAGWFWPLCVVSGLILGLILFSRWFSTNVDHDATLRRHGAAYGAALDIALERFARGEITAEELAAIKRGLSP